MSTSKMLRPKPPSTEATEVLGADRVRIGVTGHRVLVDVDRIASGIDAGLARIAPFVGSRGVTVVSGLAEGADRLAVARIMARWPDARLYALLPLPPDAFAGDFLCADSRVDLREWLARAHAVDVVAPDAPPDLSLAQRQRAYAEMNKRMLDVVEILVAVWDGYPALGQGGTGSVVAMARERGMRLIWVRAGNRDQASGSPTTLGALQGAVSLENF